MFVLRRKKAVPYDFRAIRNDLHRRWEDHVEALREAPDEARAVRGGGEGGRFQQGARVIGEAVALVRTCRRAEELIQRMTADARAILGS